MTAITAQRTRDVETAIFENADYRQVTSQAKAEAFITAVTRRIMMTPSMASRGSQSEEMRFDLEVLKGMLDDANKFLSQLRARTNGGFRLRGFTRMRLRDDP